VIFAPAQRRPAILGLIRSAERHLLISIFRCDDLTVVDELAAAVQRGVRVRVLLTQRARGWKEKLKDLEALFRSFGAEVHPYESTIVKYHAKYMVVDDAVAMVTSMNMTRKCFENTCDFIVLTDDREVVVGLRNLFENDCLPCGYTATGAGRLIIGPAFARRRVTELLATAASTITIMDHRLTDPAIVALLQDKAGQGVRVKAAVGTRAGGLISHGRLILIDQKTAIIGSVHLSCPSLDLRREVSITLEEPGLVAGLDDYYRGLAAAEASLADLPAAPAGTSYDGDGQEDE